MPWASREKHRAYQRKYNKTKKGAAQKRAVAKSRYIAEKAGMVKPNDGKDVDHKKPVSKGGKSVKSNLRVTSQKKNRGYARGRPGKVKQ